MYQIITPKLAKGDVVRVIAPARSLKILSDDTRFYADKYLADALGLKVEFSKHSKDMDEFRSSSIQDRTDDLHDAFRDPSVKAVPSVIGGYNSNQLLDHIDWELIANNPKILCGLFGYNRARKCHICQNWYGDIFWTALHKLRSENF